MKTKINKFTMIPILAGVFLTGCDNFHVAFNGGNGGYRPNSYPYRPYYPGGGYPQQNPTASQSQAIAQNQQPQENHPALRQQFPNYNENSPVYKAAYNQNYDEAKKLLANGVGCQDDYDAGVKQRNTDDASAMIVMGVAAAMFGGHSASGSDDAAAQSEENAQNYAAQKAYDEQRAEEAAQQAERDEEAREKWSNP